MFVLPRVGFRFVLAAASFAAVAFCSAAVGLAAPFAPYVYRPDLNFQLPAVESGGQGGAMMDTLPDGRLVVLTTSESSANPGDAVGELRVESGLGTRIFNFVGDVAPPADDPIWYNPGGFLAISKNTSSPVVAVGNSNYSIGVFDAAQLAVSAAPSVTWFNSYNSAFSPDLGNPNFVATATWLNNTQLAVGSANFPIDPNVPTLSRVNLLDVTSNPANPTAPLVIENAPDATGGIAFDKNGNLYYGVGSGPPGIVGEISEFPAPASPPVSEAFDSGTPVTEPLASGSWLQFDNLGNLLVGGGDFFGTSGQVNYFAIVGGPDQVQKIYPPDVVYSNVDPGVAISDNSYNVLYDSALGEILVWNNFGTYPQQVYVYTLATSVPEPSTLALLLIGTTAAGIGLWRQRRRSFDKSPAGKPAR